MGGVLPIPVAPATLASFEGALSFSCTSYAVTM
jgi:hypothetical protein